MNKKTLKLCSFYRNNYSYLTMLKYTARFILCNIFGKKYVK